MNLKHIEQAVISDDAVKYRRDLDAIAKQYAYSKLIYAITLQKTNIIQFIGNSLPDLLIQSNAECLRVSIIRAKLHSLAVLLSFPVFQTIDMLTLAIQTAEAQQNEMVLSYLLRNRWVKQYHNQIIQRKQVMVADLTISPITINRNDTIYKVIETDNQDEFDYTMRNRVKEYVYESFILAISLKKQNIIQFISHLYQAFIYRSITECLQIPNRTQKKDILDTMLSIVEFQSVPNLAIFIQEASNQPLIIQYLLSKPLIQYRITDICIQLCRRRKMEGVQICLPLVTNDILLQPIRSNERPVLEFMLQFPTLDPTFRNQAPLRLACELERVDMIPLLLSLPKMNPNIPMERYTVPVKQLLIQERWKRLIPVDQDELNFILYFGLEKIANPLNDLFEYQGFLTPSQLVQFQYISDFFQFRFIEFHMLPRGPEKNIQALYLNNVQRYLTNQQRKEVNNILSHVTIPRQIADIPRMVQNLYPDVMRHIFKFRGSKSKKRNISRK